MHITKIRINQNRFPTKDAYPFNLSILQKTRTVDLTTPVTVFIGENGTGKSTLLKAICSRCHIHMWEGVYRRRFDENEYEDKLQHTIDIQWVNGMVPGSFFSPELFRNFSQLVDEWAVSSPGILEYYGGKSLLSLSHGQSTMAYFRSMYNRKGLFFLDEPEAALSPTTQLDLLELLNEKSSNGDTQFIISTHSPILMSCHEAELYSFDNRSIARIDFKETSHYKVYKQFFNMGVSAPDA
ncbi:MAG: AAA family ATPase [Desulfobacteraceae bacterium]|nr:AAA family ATPase [Desulfobacteraceae bacterium]MBC2757153.1 AAA family ATPase [Desulfobacteraceae bacterium]